MIAMCMLNNVFKLMDGTDIKLGRKNNTSDNTKLS